jgi:hypothetical protein
MTFQVEYQGPHDSGFIGSNNAALEDIP